MARKAAQKKEVNNDGKELFEALKLLEAEKGIPVDFMIDKIKKAIATACKNSYGNEDVVIDMDPESGKFDVFLRKEIVEEVENPNREIALEVVKQYDPRAEIGGFAVDRGSYTSPATACAVYPFVYLRKPNTLLRKLFIFHKFYIRYTGGDTHSHLPL